MLFQRHFKGREQLNSNLYEEVCFYGHCSRNCNIAELQYVFKLYNLHDGE